MGKVQANKKEGKGGIGGKQDSKYIDKWEKYKKKEREGTGDRKSRHDKNDEHCTDD